MCEQHVFQEADFCFIGQDYYILSTYQLTYYTYCIQKQYSQENVQQYTVQY